MSWHRKAHRRPWIRLPRLTLAGGCACVALIAPCAGTSAAAQAPDIQITHVSTGTYPQVEIAFTKHDDNPALPSFAIAENDQPVSDVQVYAGPIGETSIESKPVVILAIDASNSMHGAKLTAAEQAADSLLGQMRSTDRVGLVLFGKDADVAVAPTTETAQVQQAVDSISLSYGTVMYDGIEAATQAFPADATSKDVVLLTDGAEVGSHASQAQAVAAAATAGVHVYTVGVGTHVDSAALRSIAQGTGGTFTSVAKTSQLQSLYASLGQQLLHAYWLTYRSAQPAGTDVKLSISASGLGTTLTSYHTPVETLPGKVAPTPPTKVAPAHPLVALPGGMLGRLIATLPFALLVGFLTRIWFARRARKELDARVAPYVDAPGVDDDDARHGAAVQAKSMLQPLYSATENLLHGSALFARMRSMIEQANIPLREVELLYAMVASAIIGDAITALVTQNLLAAVVGLPLWGLAPYAWVWLKARSRRKAFEDQLADLLSNVASSLKAGHSFNQSLTAVIKDAPEPTAHEFQRAMAEVSLGLPIDDALSSMAERMGSSDFDFAVTTVNIQRTVGGSLSEILEMVADTVRGRQQFKKKVKALTSMGTASAYVLLAMPFVMSAILTLMNHQYMQPLWSTNTGHILLAIGGTLMLLGYVACKKVVAIKV